MTPPQTRAAAPPAATVDAARAGVLAERAKLASWEAKRDRARVELAELEVSAGDQVLDDPAAAERIESQLTLLRSTVRAAERAVEAQRPRVTLAESRYLSAEADAIEAGPLAAAREALAIHEATTRRLLEQLEEHDGVYVPEIDLVNLRRAAGGDTVTKWKIPKVHAMRNEIRGLEDQVTVLREMAVGRDPRQWERANRTSIVSGSRVVYPPCVTGSDALVPTRGYLEAVERMRRTVAELEELQGSLPDEISEWKREQAHVNAGRVEPGPGFYEAKIRRAEERLKSIPAELGGARAALAALAGAEA